MKRLTFSVLLILLFVTSQVQAGRVQKDAEVAAFFQGLEAQSKVAASILNDYHDYMVVACNANVTVKDLRLFGDTPYYIDMLAYRSIALDEQSYKATLLKIPCSLFQELRDRDSSKLRK